MTARRSIRPLCELTERDIAAWRDLAGRAAEPNPFFEAEFVLAARGLEGRKVSLLVAEEADGWVACMPVVRVAHWRGLPVPALAAWRHRYSYLGTPLVDCERRASAIGALVEIACGKGSHGFFTALEWFPGEGTLAIELEHALLERDQVGVLAERFERAMVHRRPEPTYLEDRLSSKRRKELRRQRRQLETALGATLEVTNHSGPSGVEAFLEMEAGGWKGRSGTALGSRREDAAFFRAMSAAFARDERLQILSFEAEGRSVAMQCNLLAGDGLFCFKVAYDDAFAKCSPGTQLEAEAIDVFHQETGAAWMDSCADPSNELINRLFADRRALQTVLVAAPPLGVWRGAATKALSAAVRAPAAGCGAPVRREALRQRA